MSLYLLLAAVFLAISFVGCKSGEQAEYPEYAVVENAELGCVELHRDGVVYRPYGGFHNSDYRGKQIGTRESDTKSVICEVVGYSPDKWITEYFDVFMGGGNMIFKAVGVTEIPAELAEFKSYDY